MQRKEFGSEEIMKSREERGELFGEHPLLRKTDWGLEFGGIELHVIDEAKPVDCLYYYLVADDEPLGERPVLVIGTKNTGDRLEVRIEETSSSGLVDKLAKVCWHLNFRKTVGVDEGVVVELGNIMDDRELSNTAVLPYAWREKGSRPMSKSCGVEYYYPFFGCDTKSGTDRVSIFLTEKEGKSIIVLTDLEYPRPVLILDL